MNKHAPVVTGRNSLSFGENTTLTLYTYRATDGDRDTIITWDVRGTDGSDFEITDKGVLQFKEAPDYERPTDTFTDNVYEISVVARDQEGMEGTFDVTIAITELNEGPDTTETFDRTVFTVDENYDSIIATFVAKDPEDPTSDITRWSVSGRDRGDFTINQDGEQTFRYTPNFERPADSNRDNIYLVTVSTTAAD